MAQRSCGVGPTQAPRLAFICSWQSVSVAPERREYLDCEKQPAERAVFLPSHAQGVSRKWLFLGIAQLIYRRVITEGLMGK